MVFGLLYKNTADQSIVIIVQTYFKSILKSIKLQIYVKF